MRVPVATPEVPVCGIRVGNRVPDSTKMSKFEE